MDKEKYAYEFEFLREKLQKIAILLVSGESKNLSEAIFMVGCLHSICHQNHSNLKENNIKKE